MIAILFIGVMTLACSCSDKDAKDIENNLTLNSDERYLVNLYVKIHKMKINLQSNPDEIEKKLMEIRSQADSVRIQKTIEELKKDPKRWIAIYSRINELLERDDSVTGD